MGTKLVKAESPWQGCLYFERDAQAGEAYREGKGGGSRVGYLQRVCLCMCGWVGLGRREWECTDASTTLHSIQLQQTERRLGLLCSS